MNNNFSENTKRIIDKNTSTELTHPNSEELDILGSQEILTLLIEDQSQAARAVLATLAALQKAVDATVLRLQAGGRLVYVGAGTSGRLGVLDATELYPTFSWPTTRALGIMAGGPSAITQSQEGMEDNVFNASQDLKAVALGPEDVVIALAASGNTPYVVAAIQYAREVGALSIGMANVQPSRVLEVSEIPIFLDTGPEIISGSTRLKAGTAQKIALNSFSSACMVKLGKVYKNLMVDVRPSNAKLLRRAVRLVCLGADCSEDVATEALNQCDWQVKTAIVMVVKGLTVGQAKNALLAANGFVRAALK